MKPSPEHCFFLTTEIVLAVHAAVLAQFGGAPGLRDRALLESAVAAPQASFEGRSLYADLPEVAAAYLFYLCRNHPFVDGNKRAALGAALVFLRLNGVTLSPDGPEWEELVMDVSASRLDRAETSKRLRKLI